ncbi:MAG: hypothetical protein R2764_09355 [Bacteroidales bacterium]
MVAGNKFGSMFWKSTRICWTCQVFKLDGTHTPTKRGGQAVATKAGKKQDQQHAYPNR